MPAATTDAPPPDVAIAFRDVVKWFGPTEVLSHITFAVPRGTSAVVMGASGVGKSVLLRHVVQLLTPDAGEVWLNGRRVDLLRGAALDRARLSVGFLFQGAALFDSMTVAENLGFVLERNSPFTPTEREERIRETLRWVGLEDMASAYPAELSGGQQKRIGFARAIVLHPDVMLYDEPTTGLDPVTARSISDLILRLRDERGTTSITITHDIPCAERVADTVHFLYGGQIVASGTVAEVRRSNHPAVRAFFQSA